MEMWQFIVGVVIAAVTSDVAAVGITLWYQKKQKETARKTALRALLNEVERIRRVVEYNSTLKPKNIAPVTRMPVIALETAFVSGKSAIDVSGELLQAVTEYLVYADSVNSLVDVYGFSTAGGRTAPVSIVDAIVARSGQDSLSTVLDDLTTCLKRELDGETNDLPQEGD